jgi:hypothetical protein
MVASTQCCKVRHMQCTGEEQPVKGCDTAPANIMEVNTKVWGAYRKGPQSSLGRLRTAKKHRCLI